MSSPSLALPHTGLAVVTWTEDKTNVIHVHLYFQDIDLRIREAQCESRPDGTTTWSASTVANTFNGAKPAKPNSPLAAFTHLNDIHLYYLSNDNVIQEICVDRSAKDWAGGLVGPLTACNIQAHPLSRLAALPYWSGYIDCTVFYQKPGKAGGIGQLKRRDEGDVTWTDLEPFGSDAIYGTGLATVFDNENSDKILVYYQKAHNILSDFSLTDDGAAVAGTLNQLDPGPATATNTDLAAVAYHKTRELFYLGSTNWITSGSYYQGAWHIDADHPDEYHARPGSSIAVCLDDIDSDDSKLHRLFCQNSLDQIEELRFPEPWKPGYRGVVPI